MKSIAELDGVPTDAELAAIRDLKRGKPISGGNIGFSHCVVGGCKSIAVVWRPDGGFIPIKRARELSAKNGWRLVPHHGSLCPIHADEQTDQPA